MKGRLDGAPFPSGVRRGLLMHREVDAACDREPAFREARKLVAPARQRLAGIILDLCWDHFLSRQWEYFEPREPLSEFIARVYALLERRQGDMPALAAGVFRRMRAQDWLGCYGELDGMILTFRRVSRRAPFLRPIEGAVDDLTGSYAALESAFDDLMPALVGRFGNP